MKAPVLLQILTLRGHTFMPSPLSQSSTVVDLGANAGEFSRRILRWFHCRCIAVEPNPALIERVRALPDVESVWAAITDHDGEIELHLNDNPEASTVITNHGMALAGRRVRVPARSLESLLKHLGLKHVDVLKVDIEGAEIAMLLSTPEHVLRTIDQITVEFHDFCGLVTSAQLMALRSRLNACGFDSMRFEPTNINWLFVRRDVAEIGPLRRAYVKYLVRTARTLLHQARPFLGTPRLGLSPDE